MLGNSGCTLKFDYDKNIVTKYATNYPVNRLYSQYTKSKFFKTEVDHIKFPKIREWTTGGAFKMDMVGGFHIVDLAQRKSLEELYLYADSIVEFINEEFNRSDQFAAVNDLLLEKMHSIKGSLLKQDFEAICELIKSEKIKLPMGACHGDLTFANMIFKGDDIYMIDMLDSFIDSPVMDIIKLQQDTIYKWSTFLPHIRYKKIEELFAYVNDSLNIYADEQWYNNQVLHLVNIARIIPYSQKNDRILGYLYSCIQQTLSYCQSADSQRDFLVLDLNGY